MSLKNMADNWEVLGSDEDKSKTSEYFIQNGNIVQGDFNIASEFSKFFFII